MESFGARLRVAMDTRGPLCVGIDPHSELLSAWDLPDSVAGLEAFCGTVVEAFADRIAVFKPQSAFFERFGASGIGVLESTIRQCREAGALVLLDVKRGDIGSTAAAYAAAYLDPHSSIYADAITVNPYLGFASLDPMLSTAEAYGGGVFVIALTSNPDAPQFQHARRSDGRTVAQTVIDEVAARNVGAVPMGSAGIVVGANVGKTGHDVGMINGPVLAPGLGAQGATAVDLQGPFAGIEKLVLPSSSREILRHGPRVSDLREAAVKTLAECRKVLGYPF